MAIKFLNDVTVDSNVLYVDTANNRVGINATDFTTQYGVVPDLRVGSASGAGNPGVMDILRKDGNIQAGEISGVLQFSVDDDFNYAVAQIEVESAATSQTGNSGGGILKFKTTNAASGATPTEHMRVNESGNIGIGTTSPSQELHVSGNVTADRYYGNGSTTFYVDPNNTTQSAYLAGNITIDSASSPFLILDTGGFYPGAGISIRRNGSTSPTMGELSWYENPGFVGSQWIARLAQSPYTTSYVVLPTSTSRDFEVSLLGTERFRIDSATGNVGIGTTSPYSKLQVNGAVQVADDTDTASANKVGALRYRTSGNNSYVDMCMQTGASTYAWVNIVQNSW